MSSVHAVRHWYSAIAVLLVLSGLTIGSTPICAQSGSATSSAIPSNTMPSIGEQIEVAISIDVTGVNPPDDALGSFTGSLDWNPAVLAYNSNSGILAGFGGVVNDAQVSSGHLIFNGAKATGAKGNITVLRITLDVTGAGTSNLDLEYSAMAAAGTFKSLLPLLTVNDGQVQVQGSPAQYTLAMAVDPVDGGTTNPAVGVHVYASGTVVNVTATPTAGYEFDHWSGACSGSATCQVTMDTYKSVTAHFTGPTYELTMAVDPVGGGTTNPAVGVHTYADGAVVHVTAAPAAGYAFDQWSGACTGTGACQVTMNADKAVTAHFTRVTYYELTIAVDPVEGGTTDPEVGEHSYRDGTVVDIAAVPDARHEFDRWSGACTGSGSCQVTMNADRAVTAYFTELPLACHTLTLSHTGQGSDPVATPTNSTGCPSGRYLEGEAINLSGAMPDTSWQISGWIGTSQDDSTTDTNSLTMSASAHAVSVIYKAYVYLPVILGGVTSGQPDSSQTIIQENEAIAASESDPDTEAVDSTPSKISTQQIAGEQDLIAGPEYSDGSDLTSVVPDSPSDGSLRKIQQRSWMLPLLLVLVALAVSALLVVLVVSAFHLIKHRFVSSE